MFTGKEQTMVMSYRDADYSSWWDGRSIQNAFPYLSANKREFLKTGVTSEEWDSAFSVTAKGKK
jgi:hypothetical protein